MDGLLVVGGYAIGVLLFLFAAWKVFTRKTFPEKWAEWDLWPMKGRQPQPIHEYPDDANRRTWHWVQLGFLLVGSMLLVVSSVRLARDIQQAEPSINAGAASEAEPGFLDMSAELVLFINAFALPATDELQPLLQIPSGDPDLDAALSRFLPETMTKGGQAMMQPLTSGTPVYGNIGRMSEGFCEFFDAYQTQVEWFYLLIERATTGDWFEAADNGQRYAVWLDKDTLFLQNLRVLIADPRFDLMRRCVNSIGFNETRRIRL